MSLSGSVSSRTSFNRKDTASLHLTERMQEIFDAPDTYVTDELYHKSNVAARSCTRSSHADFQ